MSRFHERVRTGYARTAEQTEDDATYRRGSIVEPIKATIAGGTQSADKASGVHVNQHGAELLIRPEFLTEFRFPQMGDEIIFDDSSRRFNVVADEGDKLCWRWSEGGQIFLRVTVDELDPIQ